MASWYLPLELRSLQAREESRKSRHTKNTTNNSMPKVTRKPSRGQGDSLAEACIDTMTISHSSPLYDEVWAR